ncbi:hypothetical protein VNO78_15311 [Psophocarpus tetragonolobus]|uniref:S-protein homolog n=1 Tax=Psophocarpus tetragonolobus TaxID=3891 RepID=A0AAN9SJH1_PSOTE
MRKMCVSGKSVCILYVIVTYMLWANNAVVVDELLIQVTNTLDNGSLNLSVTCPKIASASHLILPGKYYQWLFSGDITPANQPFLCTFQWPGASHSFNMYDPSRDSDCQECNWRIAEKGPCRLRFPSKSLTCYNWI